MLPVAASVVSLLAWVYLLAGRGAFWHFRARCRSSGQPQSWPRVAAIVPARNEADLIARAVSSLMAQRYPGELHVFVVDDASQDGTAAAARAAAPGERLTIVQARPLPEGWSGKLWAMSEGVAAATRFHPERYLFTDADIKHPPDSVAALVNCGRDLVSVMARLRCESGPEKLLIPAFVFFFFMLYPPAWVAEARRRAAAAAWGCMLVRRSALERAGGMAPIRSCVIDDCALAQAVKRAGGTVCLGLNEQVRSLRAYGSFSEIGRMIARSAFAELNHSVWLLAGAVAGMVIVFLAPPLLLLANPPAAWFGASAWALMSVAYAPALVHYRRSLLWGPALPLAALFYVWATIRSAVNYWRGAGAEWKGRIQDP